MRVVPDPEERLHPYAFYAAMRRSHPVAYDAEHQIWAVFRYDDVRAILADPATFSSDFTRFQDDPRWEMLRRRRPRGRSLLASDPPLHRKLRDLVSRAFTPRAVQEMEPRMADLTRGMLDQVAPAGRMDVIADLACPLPVTVIAEMLGVPTADRARFKRWSDRIIASTDALLSGSDSPLLDEAEQVIEQMSGYFQKIIDLRRRQPQDDLITALVRAEVDGERLSEDDLTSFCVLLLVAGNVTTTNLIGNAVRCLLDHPAALVRLQAEPALVPAAIEEVLRYESPVQALVRVPTRNVELGGHTIRAGDRLVAWIGSANRDEARFREPDRFDIDRNPAHHIAFGYGIHYCLGAPLARLEAKVALTALLQRLPCPVRDGDEPLESTEGFILHGVTSLPIRFRREAA